MHKSGRRVGVIGVGNMGGGMARNLLQNGFAVTVCDVRPEPVAELVAEGAHPAQTPAEVGAQSDIVFVMVLNAAQARGVLLGEGGVAAGMASGGTVIGSATIGRADTAELAAELAAQGIDYLDAPVSGGAPGASAGTLTVMASGPAAVLARCRPALEAIGRDIYHVGEEPGQGQTVKTALAVLVGVTFAGIAEALMLGTKVGVQPEVMQEVFGTSVVGSFLFNSTTANILARNFHGNSHISTMYKDLSLAAALGKEARVPLFTLHAAFELFEAGQAMNPDEDNWTIIKVLETITGSEVVGSQGAARTERENGNG